MTIARNISILAGNVPSTGVLPITNGGTNSTATPISGSIAYGTGNAIGVTAAGTTGQVLTSAGAGVPTWATWNALTSNGNVDGGGNIGWSFGAIVTKLGNFFLMW